MIVSSFDVRTAKALQPGDVLAFRGYPGLRPSSPRHARLGRTVTPSQGRGSRSNSPWGVGRPSGSARP